MILRLALQFRCRYRTTMRVLHISADFPDPLLPAKTRAIANLLELAPEHEHRVWSLNRVDFRHGVNLLPFGDGHHAVAYGAPPKGIALVARLARVADAILEVVTGWDIAPDVIHAHKLSVEGLVGAEVARTLGRPLIVSSQGNTDLKIIGARRDLRPHWRAIWKGAAVALPFAPWTWDGLDTLLGAREGPTDLLPCPIPEIPLRTPVPSAHPLVRTAFNLGFYKNKNATGLMRAIARLGSRHSGLTLEIIGGGDANAFAILSEQAASLAPGRIRLLGPHPQAEVPALFNGASCMALPSHRESFGMVFVEALLAGCPVLGPAGFAIDGYLPDGLVGLFVPSRDEAAIAEALDRLLNEEAVFKRRLAELQARGGLDLFRRTAIAATYTAALKTALETKPPPG
jgi:glycosyltransferase involved in cell wall biosynthesis